MQCHRPCSKKRKVPRASEIVYESSGPFKVDSLADSLKLDRLSYIRRAIIERKVIDASSC